MSYWEKTLHFSIPLHHWNTSLQPPLKISQCISHWELLHKIFHKQYYTPTKLVSIFSDHFPNCWRLCGQLWIPLSPLVGMPKDLCLLGRNCELYLLCFTLHPITYSTNVFSGNWHPKPPLAFQISYFPHLDCSPTGPHTEAKTFYTTR